MTKKSHKIAIILLCFLMFFSVAGFFISMPVVKALEQKVTLAGDKVINNTWLMYPNASTTIKPTGPAQNGYPLKNINDGNFNTFWHADWDTNQSKNPVTKILPSKEIYTNGLMYATRQDSISGSLSKYEIKAVIDGKEEVVATGKIDNRIGIYFIPFTKICKTKEVIINSQFSSCSELSLAYINYEKLPEIIEESRKVYNQANALIGESEGKYPQVVVDKLEADIITAQNINEKTTVDEKVNITSALIESVLSISDKVIVDGKPTINKLKQAETILNSIPEGNEVLHMDKVVRDGYVNELKEIALLIGEGEFCRKDLLREANIRLDKVTNSMSKDVKSPIINCWFDNDYQRDKEGNIINYTRLTDGDEYSGWLYNYNYNNNEFNRIVNSNDEKLFFEYDYQNPVQIDSLTVASYFASNQSVTKVKVQAFNGQKYEDVETLNFDLYGTTSKVIYQTRSFTNPFKATKIRVHIDGAKTGHGAIDLKEMKFSLSADESEVSIVLDRDKLELREESVYKFKPVVLPFYLSNKNVEYSSSDSNVAEVNDKGVVKVKTLPQGEIKKVVTITAKTALYGKTATCEITVLPGKATEQLKKRTIRKIEIVGYLIDAEVNIDAFDQDFLAKAKAYLNDAKNKINETVSLGAINEISENIDKIKEELKTSNKQNIIQAKALIERITKDKNADEKFEYELIRKINGHDVFGLSWNEETKKPVLKGNSTVSLSMAFNYYLKNYLYQTVPYIGDYKVTIPENMVAIDKKDEFVREIPFDIRILRNMTDGVYTYRYYGLDDHERIADWMALNGYNYIIALWNSEQREKYVRLGISLTGSTFSGGMNINEIPGLKDIIYEPGIHIGGPNDKKYTVLDENLKDKDGNVLKDKEGNPLTPDGGSPFYGCVAVSAARWQGIAPGTFYISPFIVENHQVLPEYDERAKTAMKKFIDFSEVMYERGIDQRLLKKYGFMPEICIGELITEAGFVAESEAFPKDKVISVFSDAFLDFNPYGKWCHTSWTIQDWVTRQFDKDHFIVQDLECERNPKWQNSNEFYGSEWIYSVIQNFGGNNGLTGDLNKMAVDVSTAMATAKHLKGIGFAPEAGEVDPLFADYFSELIFMTGKITDGTLPKAEQYKQADKYTDNWLKHYAKRRYGAEIYDANLEKMNEFMVAIHDNLYNKFVQQGPSQAVVCGHPVINGTPKARTWGTTDRTYSDIRPLFVQWKNLIEIGKSGKTMNEQFKYDLVDYSRQVMADFSLEIYQRFKSAYSKHDVANAEKYLNQMITLCDDLDTLLGTNYMFTVARREDIIRNGGYVKSEEKIPEMLLYDKMKNTIFDFGTYNLNGDSLNDYANRHWSGMMSFYKGRWEIFKKAVMTSMKGGAGYNQHSVNIAIRDQSFAWARTPYTKEETTFIYKNNELEVAQAMYNKYIKILNDVDPSALISRYEELSAMDLTGYTAESVEDFNQLLNNAKTIIDKEDATKSDIDTALNSLKNATTILKADKKELQTRYDTLKNIDLSIYTKDSVTAFNNLLDGALSVINKADATVTEISTSLSTLKDIELTVLVADKESLTVIYNNIKSTSLKGYSAESVAKFNKILDEAKLIIDKEDATAEEIKNTFNALNNAKDVLVIDKSGLIEKYNQLNSYDKTGYTAKSIESFNNILAKAKAIIDKEDASINEIEGAITTLERATNVLKADNSSLKEKYDQYKQTDLSKYTDESVKTFNEAMNKAENVLSDNNATKEAIAQSLTEINDAYGKLVEKSGCGASIGSQLGVVFLPLLALAFIVIIRKSKYEK